MLIESLAFIAVGFGLGLLHALDADHIMAVSSLSNSKPSLKKTLLFSANWALGHGAVLLLSGIVLFTLGLALPASLQQLAEASVGVVLMVLGLHFFWRFDAESVRLRKHKHGDLEHIHWADNSHVSLKNAPAAPAAKALSERHTPVLVGVLHGLAGSAPALALIPTLMQGKLYYAMAYLLLFSVGVMLSMLLFGLGLNRLQSWLNGYSSQAFAIFRRLIASASIVLGGFWLYQAV